MTERVAVYARVSTDAQEREETIENQLHACRELCARRGYDDVVEFLDQGVSGGVSLAERPAGAALLAALEAGSVHGVVIYCVDRLSRDNETGVPAYNLLNRLSNGGVEFVIQSFDDSPEGKLQFHIFMALADYERGVIRRRTMEGKRRRVRDGRYMCSTAPFGYAYEDGQLRPHPEYADVVRKMFDLALHGHGTKEIVAWLEAEGVLPPPRAKLWYHTTVYKFLKHRRYMGENTYAGELPMPCPPLVSEDVFEAVQLELKRRRLNAKRSTRGVHVLEKLVYCGHCGSRYTARTTTRGRKYSAYYCRRRADLGKRFGHDGLRWWWRDDVLEPPITELLLNFLRDPDWQTSQIELAVHYLEERAAGVRDRVVDLTRQLGEVDAQEERLIDAVQAGALDAGKLDKRVREVRDKRRELRARLDEAHATNGAAHNKEMMLAHADKMRDLAKELGEADLARLDWSRMPRWGWQAAARYLVERVTVNDDGSLDVVLTAGGRVTLPAVA